VLTHDLEHTSARRVQNVNPRTDDIILTVCELALPSGPGEGCGKAALVRRLVVAETDVAVDAVDHVLGRQRRDLGVDLGQDVGEGLDERFELFFGEAVDGI
jgi:hypothetical protein